MPGQPNLSIGPVLPAGAERTARFLDYFVGPDVDEAWIAEMLAFDDQVGAEDTVLVERVQKGCAAAASTTATCWRSRSGSSRTSRALVLDALA